MPRVIPLTDLNAEFIRVRMEPAPACLGRTMPDGSTQWGGFPSATVHHVPFRGVAHGIQFDCPDDKSDGHKHQIFFSVEVPGDMGKNHLGEPVRWTAEGEFLDTLSLTPSIATHGAACAWHGWVKNGALEID